MRRRVVLLSFLCIFLVPALGLANGVPWPDWKGGDNTLWAQWSWVGYTPSAIPEAWAANPVGLPSPGLYLNWNNHDLGIQAFNYDNNNPFKRGWVLFASTYDFTPDVSIFSSAQVKELTQTTQYTLVKDDKTYYVTEWEFRLEPNPCFENVYFDFNRTVGDLTNCLSGDCLPSNFIALATQCVVPIPGAVWLFGAGLVGLLGFRRKFKK